MGVLSTLCSCPAIAWQASEAVLCRLWQKVFLQLAGNHCTDYADVSMPAYVAFEQARASQRGREEVWDGGQQAA